MKNLTWQNPEQLFVAQELIKIVKLKCCGIKVNNYRRVVRNQTIIDQTEDLYHLNLPQDSGFASPEGSFTVKEITTAINSFSEEYRIPFSMHVAGYKYHEIAEKMDLPLGTVKSRIFFARQRLQEMLKDYK